ncbi:MAG: lytic murein transglycosylase B, partial [Pseudomonadota bacterium]|nr:lytic murein transglycosylase B [Pseudomonadota bacterium]
DKINNSNDFLKPFIDNMVSKHHFDHDYLDALFSSITINPLVTKKMNTPYEAKPWQEYRGLFVTEKRIHGGAEYWQHNKKILEKAEREYGVPAHVIVAIIGVESKYGQNAGQFPVLETLTTLAFNYPSRAPFFTKELENFLLLTREQQINPLTLVGSYAGAIGMPQFMPSSYRHYAVNFAGNRNIDLVHNDADVIGSVANYLAKNGWKKNLPVALPAQVQSPELNKLQQDPLKPSTTLSELASQGISWQAQLPPDQKAAFFTVQIDNKPQYWVGLHNFMVISRYNHNLQYVLAVHELAEAIKGRRQTANKDKREQNT